MKLRTEAFVDNFCSIAVVVVFALSVVFLDFLEEHLYILVMLLFAGFVVWGCDKLLNDGYRLTNSTLRRTKACTVAVLACATIYSTHAVVALLVSVFAASAVVMILVDQGSASNR